MALVAIVVAAAVSAACGSDRPGGSVDSSVTGWVDQPATDDAAALGRTTRVPGGAADGGSDGDSGAGTSTSRPAEIEDSGSTAPSEADRDAVLAAVDCYFDTIIAANNPPNPQHEGYDRCFGGAAKQTSIERTIERASLGQVVTDPDGPGIKSTVIVVQDSERVLVVVCVLDNAVVRDSSGVVDAEVVTLDLQLQLERSGANWLVVGMSVLTKTEGEAPCRF